MFFDISDDPISIVYMEVESMFLPMYSRLCSVGYSQTVFTPVITLQGA